MKIRNVVALALALGLSGCVALDHAFCAPYCQSESHSSSSLVTFLYPHGDIPPPDGAIPQLHVPLRVGLAFLPPQETRNRIVLAAAKRDELLAQIQQRFENRKFVAQIVVIPDYYLQTNRGFAGLEGVQRLYNVDVMALVSYDQVTHEDDNKLSLGYITIVGAYVLKGSTHDVSTLVDLAVVDPATHSLVLRAGGTDTRHASSTLIDVDRDSRVLRAQSFDLATDQMIEHFDIALNKFESDVRDGKANVRVVRRDGHPAAGGGALQPTAVFALLGVLAMRVRARRQTRRTERALS
jgi:rhombotail lipoprotein